jgi:hypothetical protein
MQQQQPTRKGGREILFSGAVIIKIFRKEKKTIQ